MEAIVLFSSLAAVAVLGTGGYLLAPKTNQELDQTFCTNRQCLENFAHSVAGLHVDDVSK